MASNGLKRLKHRYMETIYTHPTFPFDKEQNPINSILDTQGVIPIKEESHGGGKRVLVGRIRTIWDDKDGTCLNALCETIKPPPPGSRHVSVFLMDGSGVCRIKEVLWRRG